MHAAQLIFSKVPLGLQLEDAEKTKDRILKSKTFGKIINSPVVRGRLYETACLAKIKGSRDSNNGESNMENYEPP